MIDLDKYEWGMLEIIRSHNYAEIDTERLRNRFYGKFPDSREFSATKRRLRSKGLIAANGKRGISARYFLTHEGRVTARSLLDEPSPMIGSQHGEITSQELVVWLEQLEALVSLSENPVPKVTLNLSVDTFRMLVKMIQNHKPSKDLSLMKDYDETCAKKGN